MGNTEGKTIVSKPLTMEVMMSKQKTFEWFLDKIKEVPNMDITILGTYKNMSTKILVRCNRCGNEWLAHPQHLVAGHRCRKCALSERNINGWSVRKTREQFCAELKVKNPNIAVLSDYTVAKEPVTCKCTICGNVWSARPYNLLTGTGCPKCSFKESAKKQLGSHDVFISKLHPSDDIIILGKYAGLHSNILCKCPKCNNTWYAMPDNLLKGTRCPHCKSSHGEKKISAWFDNHGIEYERQKRFDDLRGIGGRTLPYDFYIPKYNALIEYQGNYHDRTDRLQTDDDFEIRQLYDSLKQEYALRHKYHYLQIWYYDDVEAKLRECFDTIDPVTTTVS